MGQPTSLLVACLAGCLAVSAVSAWGDTPSFPDDWFFSGPQRPKALKDLEGQPASELVTQAWIGDAVSVKDSRGKVVVLDFWATWCGPCMAAIPENVALVNRYGDQGLVFIGVHDANSGWDKAPAVIQSKGINYPCAQDKGDTARNYGLQFWPTYVVIDRAGLIRAVGLLPNKVKEAVAVLLAEAAPEGGPTHAGLPAEWFFGGDNRPSWLRKVEGKPAPALSSTQWYGAPVAEGDRQGRIVVMQFVSPESELGLRQLEALAAIQKELGPQGVTFLGVCDARTPWAAASKRFKDRGIALSIMQDAGAAAKGAVPGPAAVGGGEAIEMEMDGEETEDFVESVYAVPGGGSMTVRTVIGAPGVSAGFVGGGPSPADLAMMEAAMAEMAAMGGVPPSMPGAQPAAGKAGASRGAAADALGLKLAPMTVVVDRSNTVRAVGVRPDRLPELLTLLLAEPAPALDASSGGQGGKTDSKPGSTQDQPLLPPKG